MAGKTVLITGATSGLGKATAVGLAAKGAHVAIVGRNHGRADAAAHQLNAVGPGDVQVFVADVSSQAQVRRLAADALERLPGIDVLINNVGGVVEHPARHSRRDRAHLRRQSSRSLSPDQPASRATAAERAVPGGQRRVPR